MICKNCGMQLPDDSEFCQYCGSKVSDAVEKILPIEDSVAPEENFSSKPNLIVTVSNSADTQGQENVKTPTTVFKEKGTPKKWIVAVICLSVLFLGLIALNIYQYVTAQENAAKVAELSAVIGKKDAQIKDKNSEMTTLKNKVASLEDDADNYKAIVDAVRDGSLGYAANNFQSSESIIVVGSNEKNRKFTLTANWPNGGTVSIDYDTYSPAAYVEFDQDSWTTSTKMTIEPNYTGVTIVTFSNDVNRQTFDVIIIVE